MSATRFLIIWSLLCGVLTIWNMSILLSPSSSSKPENGNFLEAQLRQDISQLSKKMDDTKHLVATVGAQCEQSDNNDDGDHEAEIVETISKSTTQLQKMVKDSLDETTKKTINSIDGVQKAALEMIQKAAAEAITTIQQKAANSSKPVETNAKDKNGDTVKSDQLGSDDDSHSSGGVVVRDYDRCAKHSILYSRIRKDFEYWKEKGGITTDMLDEAAAACKNNNGWCLRFKIIDNRVTWQNLGQDNFQTRRQAYVRMISDLSVQHELPDVDFILFYNDWPDMGDGKGTTRPFMTATKFEMTTNMHRGILIPDFTYYSWPEVRAGEYAGVLKKIKRTIASEEYKWENRISKAEWRGYNNVDVRAKAVSLSDKNPDQLDVKFIDWSKGLSYTSALPDGFQELHEACKWKYLLFLPGVNYSSRWKYLMLCNSTVIRTGRQEGVGESYFIEYWEHAVTPGEHYIELPRSLDNLVDTVKELQKNDAKARSIASKGAEFAWTHLTRDAAYCYWREVLTEYAKVQKFIPTPFGNRIVTSRDTLECPF